MKVGVLSKSLFLNDNVHGRRRLEKKQFTSEKKNIITYIKIYIVSLNTIHVLQNRFK